MSVLAGGSTVGERGCDDGGLGSRLGLLCQRCNHGVGFGLRDDSRGDEASNDLCGGGLHRGFVGGAVGVTDGLGLRLRDGSCLDEGHHAAEVAVLGGGHGVGLCLCDGS